MLWVEQMLGTVYTALIVLATGLPLVFVVPKLIHLVALPGDMLYNTVKNTRFKYLGIVVGGIQAFAFQAYTLCILSAYYTILARVMISEYGGWAWSVWPIAFVGLSIIIAAGGRDDVELETTNPELKLFPSFLVHGWSFVVALAFFFVFAIFPDTTARLWSWLPWL